MAINWSDLCNFYSEKIFFFFSIFVLENIFFLLFFAEFKYLMFHNNIVKISEKIEQAELVENLPSKLPTLQTFA